jgi:hypothetical protein
MNDKTIIIKETSIGLIKSAIGAIPFYGSAINEVLFDISSRIQQQRINNFVTQLTDQIKEIKHDKLDIDYLRSEDFYDLTRIIFESVVKIKSKEKQIALSRVYLNAIVEKLDIEVDLPALFSKFIIDLIPIQIQILYFIEANENKLVEIGSYDNFFEMFITKNELYNLDKYKFKFACNDLENKTLITMGGGLIDFDSTGRMIVSFKHKNESVKLTSIGKQFIQILK